jgi:hypothetical protein
MNQDLSLDDLYREAKAAMRAQAALEDRAAKARAKAPAGEAPLTPEGVYANPANWTRGATITLLHEESKSLLGYFVEWAHKTVPGARRLVREATLTAPQTSPVEYVSGAWEPEAVPSTIPKRPWHVSLPVTANVHLLDFHLSALAVELLCVFGEGRLDRVELTEPTTFAFAGQFLQLPAGTNILPRISPAMSQSLLNLLKVPA